MTVAERVAHNILANPYVGTNRRAHEPIDRWMRRAQIACYSCGGTNIGGIVEPLGWLCPMCIERHQLESRGEIGGRG
jgi:hypothetical protein